MSQVIHPHILFGNQIFALQVRGGVSRYAVELGTALSAHCNTHPIISPCIHQNAYLQETSSLRNRSLCIYNPRLLAPPFRKASKGANLLAELLRVRRGDISIYHPTYYDYPTAIPGHIKVVVTVHDCIHERFPEEDPDGAQRASKKRALERADAIIAISQQTKNDLEEFCRVPPERITVIHHGSRTTSGNGIRPISSPYILHVGQRQGYKDAQTLLQAFARLVPAFPDLNLLCFGGTPPLDTEKAFLRESDILSKVHFAHGSDQELADAYQHAEVFVFPSRYEGFGFPMLEAMSLGTPVIASGTPALCEIGAEAALYFKLGDAADLSSTLEFALCSKTQRTLMSQKGKENARQFSWERCAQETLALYQRLI